MADTYTTLPTVKQGDTWTFVFLWKDRLAPMNLNYCTARMQIRSKRTKTMVAEVSTADGGIVIDGPKGKVTVEFSAEVTDLIPIGVYLSDLELTFPVTKKVLSSQTVQIPVIEDITT